MKILVSYRGIPQSRGWATGDFVVKAFQALGHEAVPYGNYYQTSARLEGDRQVLEENWDLYLQMECGDGDQFYSELINVRAAKRATWWFDIALYPERWERETALLSPTANFVANKLIYNKYHKWEQERGLNITHYLPYAADSEKHMRPFTNRFQRSFALIGSDRPERRQLIDKLKSAGVDAHLITNVFREQYVDALASTEYVINDIAGGGEGLISMRPFETLAAGSMLITPKGDGCRGLDIPFLTEYENLEHLIDVCRNVWHNEIMKYRTYGYILRNHMYENRCKEILNVVFRTVNS